MEKHFSSFDGTMLRLRVDEAEEARAVLVICHGLCEHLNRYDHVTEQIVDAGITVVRYDQRGHGKSEGKDAHFDDYNEMPDDANAIVEWSQKTYPNLPHFVFGHSMGGLTAALFATKYPNKVQGILLSGALTRYSKPLLGEWPLPFSADAVLPNELGEGVCSVPEVIEAYQADPMVRKTFTAGLINECYKGIEYLRENPHGFTYPVLIMHGANDGLVAEEDSRRLFAEIASTDKGLRIYENLCHEILNERPHRLIVEEMIRWMKARI